MAVLISVRCFEFVEQQLKLSIEDTVLWTDSQRVLKWICSDKDLTEFAANRVREIKSRAPSHSDRFPQRIIRQTLPLAQVA